MLDLIRLLMVLRLLTAVQRVKEMFSAPALRSRAKALLALVKAKVATLVAKLKALTTPKA